MKPIRHAVRQAWILAIILAACAAPATTRWEKAGATPDRVNADSEECRVQVRLTPAQRSVPAPSPSTVTKALSREEERELQDAQAFQKCMRDKGYSAMR
jgi:hypothetical protein